MDGRQSITPFDEFVDELRDIGLCMIQQELNRRGKNPLQELQLLWQYRKLIKQVSPDMLITYTIKPGIYGGLLARCFWILVLFQRIEFMCYMGQA